jgi:hygromycin-B 7''-O-kinase
MDFRMDDIRTISELEYGRRFHEPTFGRELAEALRARHRLPEPLTRKIEGSNLVFRIGDSRWLKITPPFFAESLDAELQITRAVEGKLPVPVPNILQTGELDGWRYIISANVPGVQIEHVISEFAEADFEAVAVDLGEFMACFHKVRIPGFDRDYGPWHAYLKRGIREAQQIHLSRGNSLDWATQIAELLARHHDQLVRLGPPMLVHADLTPEHVLLHRVNGLWRVCGILDVADAMLAPAELDATVPMLDIFRGRRNPQQRLLREAGIALTAEGERFSLLFMAISLLHPFSFFHDWFSPEIASGFSRIADIASVVFPDEP